MKYLFLLLNAAFIFLSSCAQKNVYDFKDYKEMQRGSVVIEDITWPNTVVLKNQMDSNYSATITYEDSSYTNPKTIFSIIRELSMVQ